jgi:hypothetical protein
MEWNSVECWGTRPSSYEDFTIINWNAIDPMDNSISIAITRTRA